MSKDSESESTVSRSQSIKEDEMAEEKEAPKRVSRRQFVKGAAVGGAGVAAAGALASCAPAATPAPTAAPVAAATTVPAAAPTPVPEKWDQEADVVVVGSGSGGMSAAVAAAKQGANVIVVEVSSVTGGGGSYSGGGIDCQSTATYEEYLELTQGLHDPVLGKVYWETFQEYSPWLVDIGASVIQVIGSTSRDLKMGQGEPAPEHTRAFFDSLVSILEDAGGTILLETRALELLTDEAGIIVGLRADGPEGILNIKAKAVILACGGFQSNPGLRQRYLGVDADMAFCMGSPYNLGDAMTMAQKVGAALSDGMTSAKGSISPAHPFRNPLEDVETWEKAPYTEGLESKASLYYGWSRVPDPDGTIYVNLDGKRFVDEVADYPTERTSIIRQPQAKGIAIFDEPMYATLRDTEYKGFTGADVVANMTKAGAVALTAESISELADKLAELPTPVHKANFLKTMAEYNEAVDAGTTAELEVARTGDEVKIATPPFYAIPCSIQVYFCYGGLAINEHAQVLDSHRKPIPRLYACPQAAGGVQRIIYTGGNGCAGTFGMIAGRHAASL